MKVDKKRHWTKFQNLRRRNNRRLAAHDWSDIPIKVFVYPVARMVTDFEKEAFHNAPMLYAEDYSHFYMYKYFFQKCVGTDDPDEADYCFVPLMLPPFDLRDIGLSSTIERLELINSGKPHLFFTSWDTYPRPLTKRANPFDCIDDNNPTGIVRDEYLLTKMDWLDERFIVLAHESSIDMLPCDIGVFPVHSDRLYAPASSDRKWLFSFTGNIYYGMLADDHIRGKRNFAVWERLVKTSGKKHLVVDIGNDTAKMSMKIDYGEQSRQSVFTLCPAGWARWSYRVSEAMHAGSIPVLLSDYYEKPMPNRIPWHEFSLTLPEAALPRIERILDHLPAAKVEALQEGVKRHQHLFTPEGICLQVALELTERLEDQISMPGVTSRSG